MMIRKIFILLFCAIVAFGHRGNAATIVKDGKPYSAIIIPEKTDPGVRLAAEELRKYIMKISGARLPIYDEESFSLERFRWINPIFTAIYLGPTKAAKAIGIDAKKLKSEEFRIKVTPKDIYIVGGEKRLCITHSKIEAMEYSFSRRTTAFAVYDLLEKNLGVRWLWPGELGTVIPKQKTIIIKEQERDDEPFFPVRKFMGGVLCGATRTAALKQGTPLEDYFQRYTDTSDWLIRSRCGMSIIIPCAHTFGPRKFWEKYHNHHEWFALQSNGKRLSKPRLADRLRLCYSNPELRAEIVRIKIEDLKNNPDMIAASIGLDDSSPESYCCCEECKKYGPTLTDRVIRFSSDIAAGVAKVFPNRYLTQYAYSDWRNPPVRTKVHPNLIIYYIGVYRQGWLHAENRKKNLKLFDEWAKMVKGKMLYRPNWSETAGFPVVTISQVAEDLAHFKPKLIGCWFDCLRGSWAARGLDNYVLAKLLWNPDSDVNALIKDYCRAGFGAGADKVEEYFKLLDQNSRDIANHNPGQSERNFLSFAALYYKDKKIKELENKLIEAKQQILKSASPNAAKQAKRIDFLMAGIEYIKLVVPLYKIYVNDGDREKAKRLLLLKTNFLHKHANSYAFSPAWTAVQEKATWDRFFGGNSINWNVPGEAEEIKAARKAFMKKKNVAKPEVEATKKKIPENVVRWKNIDGANWKLVYASDFNSGDAKEWNSNRSNIKVQNGVLVLYGNESHGNTYTLQSPKACKRVRIEFDAIIPPASGKLGDISPFIHSNGKFDQGYLLMFGSNGNARNRLMRNMQENGKFNTKLLLEKNKKYHFVAEQDNGRVRLIVNDVVIHDFTDPSPLSGTDKLMPNGKVGIYNCNKILYIDNFRMYK